MVSDLNDVVDLEGIKDIVLNHEYDIHFYEGTTLDRILKILKGEVPLDKRKKITGALLVIWIDEVVIYFIFQALGFISGPFSLFNTASLFTALAFAFTGLVLLGYVSRGIGSEHDKEKNQKSEA